MIGRVDVRGLESNQHLAATPSLFHGFASCSVCCHDPSAAVRIRRGPPVGMTAWSREVEDLLGGVLGVDLALVVGEF